MPRLPRFEDHRYVGTRDTMRVYDCDDETQYASLRDRLEEQRLISLGLIQSFAPDTLTEARNRGFRLSVTR